MPLLRYYKNPNILECGLDEAGQGPLLGRVYGAAVILNPEIEIHPHLRDSKRMTPARRAVVRQWIEEEGAVDYAVAWRDEKRIDAVNILNAKLEAWHDAISQLNVEPEMLLVDGTQFREYWILGEEDRTIPSKTFVCGDGLYASIAAASVLAKEYHDDYIKELCEKEPILDEHYDLLSNKGYGTARHIEGIQKWGPSSYHRMSFLTSPKFHCNHGTSKSDI